ncbi:MAG: hypothetical protein IJE12_01095 [Prevotella sp.]|nr:hypothetical protein [Prevotella sp.]
MRELYLLISLLFIPLISKSQIDIKFGFDGMEHNSTVMLNAMCECLGQSHVFNMLDSLTYYGYFICEIDKNGYVVNVPEYRTRRTQLCRNDLNTINKYFHEHKIKMSIIYSNDSGENEIFIKQVVMKEIKHHFRHNKTYNITVGFPGYLSPPWGKYLNY